MAPNFRTKANGRIESSLLGIRMAEGEEWEGRQQEFSFKCLGFEISLIKLSRE